MLRPGQKVEAKCSNVSIGLYAYDEYVVEYVRENGDVLLEGFDFFVPGTDLEPVVCSSRQHWERECAHETLAQELVVARRDLATWAERCERAENLLRGYLQGADVEELKRRAKEHFRALGERQ